MHTLSSSSNFGQDPKEEKADKTENDSHLISPLTSSGPLFSPPNSLAWRSKLQEACDLFFQSKRKTRKTDREGDVSKTPSRILLFLSLSLLPPSNPPDSERILVP
jgi:hypothetical protein